MAILTAAELKALPGVNYGTLTDAQITLAIAQAQALIEAYCDRKFDDTAYADWLDADGGHWLRLRNWPIIGITRLSTQIGQVLWVNAATSENLRISIQSNVLSIFATSVSPYIDLVSTQTMADVAASIDSNMGGVTSTTVVHECSGWSLRPGMYGGYTTSGIVGIDGPVYDSPAYITQPETGMLYNAGLWPCGPGTVFVEYQAGYQTYPYDLQLVCAQVAMDSADMSMANITSEKIGNVAYSYGPRGIYGLLTGHESVLNKYRRLI